MSVIERWYRNGLALFLLALVMTLTNICSPVEFCRGIVRLESWIVGGFTVGIK